MPPTYDKDARLNLAEAALYFGLSKATINRWYSLGHLADIQHDDRGHRLYRFGELLQAERNTRRNPNSSRSLVRRGVRLASA